MTAGGKPGGLGIGSMASLGGFMNSEFSSNSTMPNPLTNPAGMSIQNNIQNVNLNINLAKSGGYGT